MDQKFYDFIGLSIKANKVLFGTSACENGIKNNKIHLLIVDKSVSEKTKKEFLFKIRHNKIPIIITDFVLDNNIIGKQNIKIIALTDTNLARKALSNFNVGCGGEVIE